MIKKSKGLVSKVLKIALLVVAVAFVAVVSMRKRIFAPDTFLFNVWEEDVATQLPVRLFKTVYIIVVGVLISKVGTLCTKLGELLKDNTQKTAALLVGNVLKYASAIAIVLVLASTYGIDTTAIVTGAGVITLVIGMGCQTLISDVVSGIFMMFEGDIKVGDVVVVNGWRGTVNQIGLRRTRIEDAAGNINIINNSSISNIVNNTQKLSIANCEVGIEYDESIVRVENILRENFPLIRQHIPAIVEGPFYKGISELGASSVVVKVIAKTKEEDKFQVQRDLNREIKLIFDTNNVNIPYDQITLSYREKPAEQEELTLSQIKKAREFLNNQKQLSAEMDDIQI